LEFKAKRRTLKVIVDDVSHMVKFPSLGELDQYRKEIKKEGADETDTLFNFLETLGLKKEVALSLEAGDVTEIVNIISGEKKV
jgi:6-phosphogluconate dehydrogenase (decarboxylating)